MSLNEILAREMAKSDGKAKITYGKAIVNVSPDIEWLKWLSYEPEFEKNRIEYFDSKKVSELSLEELAEASRYIRNRVFAELFKIYGTSECSKEDYMKVYKYMRNESIEELMISKLTLEELQYARQEITRLSKIPSDELSCIIKEKQGKYEQLSIVDSYILHIISGIDYARGLSSLDKAINSQLEQNAVMRRRSFYAASNPYQKR